MTDKTNFFKAPVFLSLGKEVFRLKLIFDLWLTKFWLKYFFDPDKVSKVGEEDDAKTLVTCEHIKKIRRIMRNV